MQRWPGSPERQANSLFVALTLTGSLAYGSAS